MWTWKRPTRPVAIAVTCAAMAVLAVPQPARAATTLTDGVIASRTAPHSVWYEEFDFSTTQQSWSAIGIYAPTRWRASLLSTTPAWAGLASTGWTTPLGTTQFIAVNSRQRPLGGYRLQLTRDTGHEVHVQWRQADYEIVLPTPANDGVDGPSDPDLTFASKSSADVIRIGELSLAAGEGFWVNAVPGTLFFLLEPGLSVVSRAAAIVPGTVTSGTCTLYTATTTGVYGVIVVSNNAPVTTVPASGRAVALHRFDPTRPMTCPHRNFPAPTPPGP